MKKIVMGLLICGAMLIGVQTVVRAGCGSCGSCGSATMQEGSGAAVSSAKTVTGEGAEGEAKSATSADVDAKAESTATMAPEGSVTADVVETPAK